MELCLQQALGIWLTTCFCYSSTVLFEFCAILYMTNGKKRDECSVYTAAIRIEKWSRLILPLTYVGFIIAYGLVYIPAEPPLQADGYLVRI